MSEVDTGCWCGDPDCLSAHHAQYGLAEIADLESRGYRRVDEVRGIRALSRVHHSGERWPEAYIRGTATVIAVLENPRSGFTAGDRARDIELVVVRDRPLPSMSPVTTWADYHTVPVLR